MANFYFRNFPFIKYSFGDNEPEVYFQKMSAAIDLFDNIKQDVSFTTKQTILDFERPDTLSYRLYKTVDYYWTFFLMNDKLRESGWPLHTDREQGVIEERYPYWSFITISNFAGFLTEGQELFLTGSGVAQYGEVVRADPTLGQIIFKPSYEAQDPAQLPDIVRIPQNQNQINLYFPAITGMQFETNDVTFTLVGAFGQQSTKLQYLGVHHWEDANGDYGEIDPFVQDDTGLKRITFKENLQRRNQEIREIAVLRPGVVSKVAGEFQKLIRS